MKTKKNKVRKIRTLNRSFSAAANYGFGMASQKTEADVLNNTGSLSSNTRNIEPAEPEAVGYGTSSVSLHGKTEANYDYGTGQVVGQKAAHAKDCPGCEDSDCITWSGKLRLTFLASPTIQLPGPSKYAHLSPCQQKRVKAWIKNVLTPHEYQHKAAFETYNGTVDKPFNMKICKDEMSGDLLQPIHTTEEVRRRTAANKKSDDLDPFHSNIDLDCEEEKTSTNDNSYLPTSNS